ncbi:MAG TPA: metallophosphoesterase family protein [Bryobacteraceae bacterium]|nr:metallophosphoesterase family protein [Bryobacteraceae bacterium]
MRYLILSDLHANWEALQAVLADAPHLYDRILCCGDVVGYGADPDQVTEWVRGNVANIVRGNHDKACAGLEDLEWFNPIARQSALWTQEVIKPDNRAYLRDLGKGPERIDGFEILHGSPLDEDEYMFTENEAAQVAPYLDAPLGFFGHTHVQGGFLCHRNGVKRLRSVEAGAEDAVLELENDVEYLLNPGSVGQPRDGDPRAAYAVYDLEARVVTFRRVAYDIQSAQKKIVEAGLPELLALRLAAGM